MHINFKQAKVTATTFTKTGYEDLRATASTATLQNLLINSSLITGVATRPRESCSLHDSLIFLAIKGSEAVLPSLIPTRLGDLSHDLVNDLIHPRTTYLGVGNDGVPGVMM